MIPDVRTMWIVVATTTLLFGLLELSAGLGKRRDSTLIMWGIANLIGAAGSGLLSTQGIWPYVLSEAAANAFITLGWALIWAGVRAFGGRPIPWGMVAGGPLIVVIGCLYIPPFPSDMIMRIQLASLGIVVYMALIAVDALRAERVERLLMRRVLAVLSILSVCAVAVRAVSAQLQGPSLELMANSADMSMPLLVLFVTTVSTNVCLLLIGRERLVNQLARAAIVDGLTGALNRSGFLVQAQEAAEGSLRAVRPTSVLVMDLDEFKTVNDQHGHAAGDRLLVGFASVARSMLSAEDLLGRTGGEEFCALVVGAESEAADVADRLRRAFADAEFDDDSGRLTGTVSIGVAQLRAGEELVAAIQRADEAMYQAKGQGRDRVVRASG